MDWFLRAFCSEVPRKFPVWRKAAWHFSPVYGKIVKTEQKFLKEEASWNKSFISVNIVGTSWPKSRIPEYLWYAAEKT